MDLQQKVIDRVLTNKDLFIIALALVGLILILLLLLDDRLFFKLGFRTLGQRQKIAVTSHSIKDVRRRVDTDVVWLPLSNSDDVFESDTIYTGKVSEAEIVMDSGVRFQMEPESLAVVHSDQIELKQGRIWSSSGQTHKMKITTPHGVSDISDKKGRFEVEATVTTHPEAKLEPHKFIFDEPVLPTAFMPKDGSAIELKENEKKGVFLQWNSPEHDFKFKVQVSKDLTFKDIVWESETTGQDLKSEPLSGGSYYWRVQAINSDRVSNWSKPVSFKLESPQPSPIPLQAPKLRNKHQTYEIQSHQILPRSLLESLFNLILPEARAEVAQSSGPQLIWDVVPGAVAYEVEIATDPEFKNIFTRQKAKNPEMTWITSKPGRFYWHAHGIDKYGRSGENSEVGVLDLILVSPKVRPSVTTPTDGKVALLWNHVPFAQGYEVQLSDNKDFKDASVLTTKGTSLEIAPLPKTKYWRVRATSTSSQYNGNFSKTESITNDQKKVSSLGQIKPLTLNPLGSMPGYPILFDPIDLGVKISGPKFDYEVSAKNEIRIGEIYYDGNAIELSLKNNSQPTFIFSWPKAILQSGKISLQSLDGKTMIFIDHFSSKNLIFLDETVTYIKTISSQEQKKLGTLVNLRFCAKDDTKSFKNSFCSKPYNCQFNNSSCTLGQIDGTSEPSVKINNIPSASVGSKIVNFEEKIIFESRAYGSEIHLESQIPSFQVRDIVMQDSDTVVLAGNGVMPYDAKVTERDDFNWRTAMLLKKPTVYFSGENNILFKTDIKIDRPLPYEEHRGYMDFKSPHSTYNSETKLTGLFKNPKHEVSSHLREAHATSEKEFEWTFSTPKKGDININTISLLENGKNSFTGRYGVYHGYNYEIAGRLTALLTNANSPLVLGELSGAAWFERIFNSENYLLSHQRWGISGKYFNTILNASDNTGNTITLSGYNADLRYRLTPGITNQDETFGLLLGFQSVTFMGTQGNMYGAGGFWTKPMPSFVDRFFNYIKWFRYPKILDAEFTYYPLSTDSGTTLGGDFNLLLRGKIFVRSNLFLEASVGYKQYFYSQSAFVQVQSQLLQWAGGAGLDF